MTLEARDERPHLPGADADWSERWSFAFRADDITGLVELEYVPNGARATWLTQLDMPDAGLVVVRDASLSLPRRLDILSVRGDGLWAELVCETAFEHWSIGLEAFGLIVDDPSDEIGDRLPVGLDLEWEVDGDSAVGEIERGYQQHGTMHGELLIATDRIPFEGAGDRTHTWGT